jgi:hypothetical protein
MFAPRTQRVSLATPIWPTAPEPSLAELYLSAMKGVAGRPGEARLAFLAPRLHWALLSFSRNAPCLLGVCTAMA